MRPSPIALALLLSTGCASPVGVVGDEVHPTAGKSDGASIETLALFERSSEKTVLVPIAEASRTSFRFALTGDAEVFLAFETGQWDAYEGAIEIARERDDGTAERVIASERRSFPRRRDDIFHDPEAQLSTMLGAGSYRIDILASVAPILPHRTTVEGFLTVTCDDADCIPPNGSPFGHQAARFHAGEVGTFSEVTTREAVDVERETGIVRAQIEASMSAHPGRTREESLAAVRGPLTRKILTLADGRRYHVVSWDTDLGAMLDIFELDTTRVVSWAYAGEMSSYSEDVRQPGKLEPDDESRIEIQRAVAALERARGRETAIERIAALSGAGARAVGYLGSTIWRVDLADDAYLVQTDSRAAPFGTAGAGHALVVGVQRMSRATNLVAARAQSFTPAVACRHEAIDIVHAVDSAASVRFDDLALLEGSSDESSSVVMRVPVEDTYAPGGEYVVHLDRDTCEPFGLVTPYEKSSALRP